MKIAMYHLASILYLVFHEFFDKDWFYLIYKIYIHHYAKHNKGFRSNKDPTEFRLLVDMEGSKKEFKGEISNGEPLRLVAELALDEKDVKTPPPTFEKVDIDDSLLDDFEQNDSTEDLVGDIL